MKWECSEFHVERRRCEIRIGQYKNLLIYLEDVEMMLYIQIKWNTTMKRHTISYTSIKKEVVLKKEVRAKELIWL